MFEQSLLANPEKKPWNFLVSASIQSFAVALVLFASILYRDRLPAFHWNDVITGPPLASPPPVQAQPAQGTVSANRPALHRVFIFDPRPTGERVAIPSAAFAPEAPPAIGVPFSVGGGNDRLGTFLPNPVSLPPPPARAPAAQNPPAPIHVTSDLQMAKLVRKIIPEYPPIARSARISGIVRLIGTISKDGTIENLQLVSGHPMLAHAALEAVQQWVYQPTLLNGRPVEVIAPIEVKFTLGQ